MFRDEGRFAFALRALERREFDAAEAALSQHLAQEQLRDDQRVFLLNKRGVARVGMDCRELARADFEAALELAPHYAPALTNLGNLAFDEGRVDSAIASYESAIAADADYAIAFLNLGAAYKRAGRLAEGVRALRHAQRLERRANSATVWRRVRPR